jgi:uncharacterized damage-inducible protein DinB
MNFMKEAIETWTIHNSMNLYLLNSLEEAYLSDSVTTKGRCAGEQFAHIHNVRLMWLKAAAPALLEGVTKIEKATPVTKSLLQTALTQSGEAIAQLLEKGFAEGRIKGFTPHPFAFMGYLISHESHHRGQIMICLKSNGHLPDKKVQFGLWEWGKVKE